MVNRELKEMDETKLKFIGIASHELKTPLTIIKANVDFILSEKEGKVPEYLKSYLLYNPEEYESNPDENGSNAGSEPDSNLTVSSLNREPLRLSEAHQRVYQ